MTRQTAALVPHCEHVSDIGRSNHGTLLGGVRGEDKKGPSLLRARTLPLVG